MGRPSSSLASTGTCTYTGGMGFTETALLLLFVIDPFGSLPVVVAVLARLTPADYRRAVSREVAIAFAVLVFFALAGERFLSWLGIEQPSLQVAGGIVLFLISLDMIFASGRGPFTADAPHRTDPIVVPIAMPLIAGPSAITLVLLLAGGGPGHRWQLLAVLAAVLALTWIILLFGRRLAHLLGARGMRALVTLSGMLLCLLAVNMALVGFRTFWRLG